MPSQRTQINNTPPQLSDQKISTANWPDRIIRLPEVMHLTGLQRSTLYAMMAAGDFPQNFCLGPRVVGWSLAEISQWIATRRR